MSQINESAIKTPGVYVNEIPSFPPSIAQVATAVPAFIGYTQSAHKLQDGDLNLVPTKIRSLVEYNLYFGFGPDPGITEVDIDANNVVTKVVRQTTYYLYDSIRMFFLNGGSVCYICSIGTYQAPAAYSDANFTSGLAAVKKYDEPTLLLFPDAVLLTTTQFYTIQKAALQQCNDLQDRFCIFDLLEKPDWQAGVDDFRNNIGIQFLNYGAAYTPYLNTSLGLNVVFKNLSAKILQAGVPIDLKNFTTSVDVQDTLTSYTRLIADTATINAAVTSLLTGGNKTLQQQWLFLVNDYQASFVSSGPSDTEGKFQALISFIYTVANKVDDWAVTLQGDNAGLGLKKDVKDLIVNSLRSTMTKLLAYDQAAETVLGGGASDYFGGRAATIALFTAAAQWGTTFTALPAPDASIYGPGPAAATRRQTAVPAFTTLFNQVDLAINQILNLVSTYENNFEQTLLLTHPVYKQIVTAVQNTQSSLPPSGAIAGIYATVDGIRGVWKAPANASINGVSGLTFSIDDAIQQDLNIDTMAGKSINAIRAFTGKGILVWGARTLEGNSNDWRYISVRRLYI
ncbi:MAG: hypothetical protein JWQ09_4752, partial [Segetibacter sp.]|nr:hypothetical protein [Segetibacter sp.]